VELGGDALGDGLPRGAEALAVLLDVGAARVGELERLAALVLDAADEALVPSCASAGYTEPGLGRQTPPLRSSISCIRP
jgi:hypothetical protein